MSLIKAIKHFHTVNHHRKLVCEYCFRAGLYWQGLTHDLSKYSPTEFLVGAKYYQGNRSPNNAEREATGMSLAWLHHKGRNRHHYEYWIDYSSDINDRRVLCGMQMPRRYVAEMVFDRISASRTYLGDKYTQDAALNYYLRAKDRLWFVHPTTKKELEFLLRMWAEKGEDATIRYIKYIFLKKKGHRRMESLESRNTVGNAERV